MNARQLIKSVCEAKSPTSQQIRDSYSYFKELEKDNDDLDLESFAVDQAHAIGVDPEDLYDGMSKLDRG
jgi:hypothetical protein